MFKNKSFNVAFLISLSWHIFLIFCVTIVVLPVSFPMAKLSKVSFLGPILEKTAFEIMLGQRTRPQEALYETPMHLDDSFLAVRKKKLDEVEFGKVFVKKDVINVGAGPKELLGDFKFTPPFKSSVPDKEVTRTGPQENFLIDGPLAEREILFKPQTPFVPKRIGQKQESFVVELRLRVPLGGGVEEAALLVSSGYPDVDLAAINYAKAFKFTPSAAGSKEEYELSKMKVMLRSR